MSESIGFQLSKLENDYYDGVGTEKLIASIEKMARYLGGLERQDPTRRAFEKSAFSLWGRPAGSAVSYEAVHAAMQGEDAADYVRSWANFWKVFAAEQNLERTG